MTYRPIVGLACTVLTLLPGVIVGQEFEDQEDRRPGVAALRFENSGSYGSAPMELGALEVGLQQMLLTELSQNTGLRIVERGQLDAILAEQDLGQSGRITEGTEAGVGQLVGARYMIAGTFLDVDGRFRMDARIFDVQTSEIIRSVGVEDDRELLYDLVINLAGEIANGLDLPALDSQTLSERQNRIVPPEAIVMFAWAQVFEDRGDPGLAADTYQRIMQLYPDLEEARDEWLRLRGDWELGVYLGTLNDEPEFVFSSNARDDFRRDAMIGVRLGYHMPRGFTVEAELGQSLVIIRDAAGGRQNMNVWPIMASLEWNYHLRHDLQAFIGAGFGAIHFQPDRTSRETNFALNLRAGGRLLLSRNHALRFDLRYFRVSQPLSKTIAEIGVNTRDTLGMLEASIGFSWFPAGG